jgi:hypothetical protein
MIERSKTKVHTRRHGAMLAAAMGTACRNDGSIKNLLLSESDEELLALSRGAGVSVRFHAPEL